MKHPPEHIEALQVLEKRLQEDGYHTAPFSRGGKLANNPASAIGVIFAEPGDNDENGMPRVHHIEAHLYMGPPQKHEPTIHCMTIDQYDMGQMSSAVQRRLALPAPRGWTLWARHGNWNTEIFLLPHELVGFAGWLPHWVSSVRGRAPYVEHPYPVETRGQIWCSTWTQAAWATYHTWEKVLAAARAGARPPTQEMS